MKRKIYSIVLFFFLIVTPFALLAQDQIRGSIIANGGAVLTGESNKIAGTVGQSLIGESGNQTNVAKSGFWEQLTNLVTSVEEINDKVLPKEFNLYQNYPNPFNPSTTIQFALPKESFTKLEIFNAIGERVETLITETLAGGVYQYKWDANKFSSGVYFYRLIADNFVQTKKLLLMK